MERETSNMESHILNSYHQARYRTIGHKVMRAKSDSVSSESSTQNSPEYTQIALQRAPYVARTQSVDSNGEDWGHNQTTNNTHSSQDTSSDEESETCEDVGQNIVVQEQRIQSDDEQVQEIHDNCEDENVEADNDSIVPELDVPIQTINSFRSIQLTESIEDNSLVEGQDYDVILVFTVNPDTDLIESSSDDEHDQQDLATLEKDQIVEREYLSADDNPKNNRMNYASESAPDISSKTDFNRDTPHISNAKEYLIWEKNILEADGLVVRDVDEYFIKDKGKENQRMESMTKSNLEDFFIKHKLPEDESTQFHKPEPNRNDDEFLAIQNNVEEKPKEKEVVQEEVVQLVEPEQTADVSINESKSKVCPDVEHLERFILEEMPLSPIQNICTDINDVFNIEDLNLDLSDLTFYNDLYNTDSINKSCDISHFLTEEGDKKNDDNVYTQDMEIEDKISSPIVDVIPPTEDPFKNLTSAPIPKSNPATKVIDFYKEKALVIKGKPPSEIRDTTLYKKELSIRKETEAKPAPKLKTSVDLNDFVDVESCCDTVTPVLEANNLCSLLKKPNKRKDKKNNKSKNLPLGFPGAPKEQKKPLNKNNRTNGMRLQDHRVSIELNKTKIRQILMPLTTNTAIRRSPSPVHCDHDYCSSVKYLSLPNLKGGQSILKPEVLSSNSGIQSSRHRICKNKKIVYNLSSDDESEIKAENKKETSDGKFKNKTSVKPAVKPSAQSNCFKKISPTHIVSNDVVIKDKRDNLVNKKCNSKVSDAFCSHHSNSSIKLTIVNKSEANLNNDLKDSQKDKYNNNVDKCKSSSSANDVSNIESYNKQETNIEKHTKEVDKNKNKSVNNVGTVCNSVIVKEKPRPKVENFYNPLFSNKQDVKMPQVQVKPAKRSFEDELNQAMEIKKEKPKKKKIKLQDYKLQSRTSSNNSSTTVRPEAISTDMPNPLFLDKNVKPTPTNGFAISTEKGNNVFLKKIFDPISEASRKILANTKKQEDKAKLKQRKRDDDILRSRMLKAGNLELTSDVEMMKIFGMNQPEAVPAPITNEKLQQPADYVKIVLISVGTNTDQNILRKLEADLKKIENSNSHKEDRKQPIDQKSHINFKIKKSDYVLKKIVFDEKKRDKRSLVDQKKHSEVKIYSERCKDITATLKSVRKHVDTKMSSNSLFASIEDEIIKKVLNEEQTEVKASKLKSPVEKHEIKFGRTTIVRAYDVKANHGEDKIILHLRKHRSKPTSASIVTQTDPIPECPELSKAKLRRSHSRRSPSPRSKSPVAKKAMPKAIERKCKKPMTPPLRKPTVSESSDSSSSSSASSTTSSSSSSSSSDGSMMSRSCSPYQRDDYRQKENKSTSKCSEVREINTPVELRREVFIGKLEKDVTTSTLRGQFSKFGPVLKVRLHSKKDGSRYGFVTYQRAHDAWTAVKQASSFPQYDVGFGGRRAFCRQSYADLNGIEAKYTESAFHGAGALPARRTEDMSFEQMLLEMKKKLSQRKSDMNRDDPNP